MKTLFNKIRCAFEWRVMHILNTPADTELFKSYQKATQQSTELQRRVEILEAAFVILEDCPPGIKRRSELHLVVIGAIEIAKQQAEHEWEEAHK